MTDVTLIADDDANEPGFAVIDFFIRIMTDQHVHPNDAELN